jgi:hypothetical protein
MRDQKRKLTARNTYLVGLVCGSSGLVGVHQKVGVKATRSKVAVAVESALGVENMPMARVDLMVFCGNLESADGVGELLEEMAEVLAADHGEATVTVFWSRAVMRSPGPLVFC